MNSGTFSRRLTAIVSADATGYSRLMGDDDLETVRTLKDCRRLITETVVSHGGRVVDSPGDNLLAEYPSVVDAVTGSLAIQEKLAEYNRRLPAQRQMAFRIGIDLGDVIDDGERIYGEGVNIAARLEGLAEAGGICISGSAYEQVRGKVPLGCEYIGEQSVKNISLPVPVYRVWQDPHSDACRVKTRGVQKRHFKKPLAAAAALFLLLIGGVLAGAYWGLFDTAPAPETLPEAGVRTRASIAVLPFTNLGKDPQQEYFSDGITRDIITDLARFPELTVSNSEEVFAYKGKATDIPEIGRKLGVDYVLEGSLQKAGSRIRINAHLVDAESGDYLWAERYNRNLEDLFALQDDIIESIVRELSLKIGKAEQARALRKDPSSLKAYDWVLRGWHHYNQRSRADNRQAREFFQRAIEIDPDYAAAYLGLAETRMWAVNYGYTEFPNKALQQALKNAVTAVDLDPFNANARGTLGYIYMRTGEYELAEIELKRAIELNPNDWRNYRHMGAVALYSGRPAESLTWYEKVMQFDPHISPGVLMNIGISHYLLGETAQAVPPLKEATTRWPDFLGGHIVLAAVYATMGRMEDARKQAREVLRIAPFFETEFYGAAYRNPDHRRKIIAGLHKAGLE